MGKITRTIEDKLIPDSPDRNANRARVYWSGDELVIHWRDLKVVLHTPAQQQEWIDGFRMAMEKLREGGYFKQDL